jgi:hypothetical protein
MPAGGLKTKPTSDLKIVHEGRDRIVLRKPRPALFVPWLNGVAGGLKKPRFSTVTYA